MRDPKLIMNNAKDFAGANLRECASEIVEWRSTGLLKDGSVRGLARILDEMGPQTDALQLAESLVIRAALCFAMQSDQKTVACACGLPTCVEPWEPGCGLGTSGEHARVASDEEVASIQIAIAQTAVTPLV